MAYMSTRMCIYCVLYLCVRDNSLYCVLVDGVLAMELNAVATRRTIASVIFDFCSNAAISVEQKIRC